MPTAGDVKLPAMPWTGEDPATEHSCAKRPTLMRAESVDGMVDAIDVCQRNHPVTRYPFNAAARGAVTLRRYVKPFRHHVNSVGTRILAASDSFVCMPPQAFPIQSAATMHFADRHLPRANDQATARSGRLVT